MAMIKCFECKRDISDQAKQCPHCGYVTSRSYRKRVSQRFLPSLLLMCVVTPIWMVALVKWSSGAFWLGLVILFAGMFAIDHWVKRDRRV